VVGSELTGPVRTVPDFDVHVPTRFGSVVVACAFVNEAAARMDSNDEAIVVEGIILNVCA
jgi:hypothetical protein